jgi:hypothetical protein
MSNMTRAVRVPVAIVLPAPGALDRRAHFVTTMKLSMTPTQHGKQSSAVAAPLGSWVKPYRPNLCQDRGLGWILPPNIRSPRPQGVGG